MKIRILENTKEVLFDSENIGVSLVTFHRGSEIEVESISDYKGRYNFSYSGKKLKKLSLSKGMYYTLSELMFEVLDRI